MTLDEAVCNGEHVVHKKITVIDRQYENMPICCDSRYDECIYSREWGGHKLCMLPEEIKKRTDEMLHYERSRLLI